MSTPAVVSAGRHAGGHGPSGRPAVVAALAVTQTVGYGTLYLVQAHTAAISALTVHLVAALVSWGHRPTFAASVAGILVVPMTLAKATARSPQQRCRPPPGATPPSCCTVAAAATAATGR